MKNKFITYPLRILKVLSHPKILLAITIFMILVDYVLFKIFGDHYVIKSKILAIIFLVLYIPPIIGFAFVLASKFGTAKWYKSLFPLLILIVISINIYTRFTHFINQFRILDNIVGLLILIFPLTALLLLTKHISAYLAHADKRTAFLHQIREGLMLAKPLRFYITIIAIGIIVFGIYRIHTLETRLQQIESKLGGKEKIACNDQQTVDRVRKSVVRVVGGLSEGSGFSIKENVILTNFHVIEFEPSPKIIFPDNSFETGLIIMADKNADLAMIQIHKDLPVLTLGDSKKLVGAEELLAIGFPFGGDLKGESSVNKGSFSGRRHDKTADRDLIQTDTTLNPGVSGGPMTDECGEVMGVNTAGTAGLGLAISSETIRKKWVDMAFSKDSLKDIVQITFEPNKSPIDTVSAFYNYLKIRRLNEAFALLSDNFKRGYGYDSWKQGYGDLLDTTVIKIENDKTRENFVHVKLGTKNLTADEIVTKFFEGYWEIRKVGDDLQLWDANIKEVINPEYLWFYE